MSFWQIIKLLGQIFTAHRRYKRGMDQLRTSSLHLNGIKGVLDAYRKGEYEEALQVAETMKGNPQLAGSYFFFTGTMLMQLGHFEEAERRLRRNLTSAPDAKRTALGYSSLGQLLLELKRYDEAVECFQTSLRHWPDRGSSHRDLAEACLRQGGRSSDAVKWAQLAVTEDRARDNPTGSKEVQESSDINLAEDLSTLAWAVAADSRDGTQVNRLVEEALSLTVTAASPAAQVRCHAGHAYLALGDGTKGAQHFADAARIDPYGLWGRTARAMTDSVTV